MIRYDLKCHKLHTFDAWFSEGAAFDAQVKRKLVACPKCGSTRVEKALMAPRLNLNAGRYRSAEKQVERDATSNRDDDTAAPTEKRARKRGSKSLTAMESAKSSGATMGPGEAAAMGPGGAAAMGLEPRLLEALREIRREVTSKAEYVGRRFADEARKIHLEEAPARGIYGEASLEEVRSLVEDGIECAPLPTLPEDRN